MNRTSDDFRQHDFRRRVGDCLEQTRKILLNERQLTTLDKVTHKYSDKYHIVDYLGRAAIVCYLNCFSALGLSTEDLAKLASWSECLDVTLRWQVDSKCIFVGEAKRDVENPNRVQTEVVGMVGSMMKTSKVITTVIDYHYLFTARYELVAYRGVGDTVKDRMTLQSRSSEQDIVTSSAISPYPGATIKHTDLNISWLLRRIDSRTTLVNFSIDRDHNECHTPSCNKEVSAALDFFMKSKIWCEDVIYCFLGSILTVQLSYGQDIAEQDLTSLRHDDIFVPVYPLVGYEVQSTSTSAAHLKLESDSKPVDNDWSIALDDTSLARTEITHGGVNTNKLASYDPPAILTDEFVNQLLSEHERSLQAKFASLATLFPPSASTPTSTPSAGKSGKSPIMSVAEAKLNVTFANMSRIAIQFRDSVQFIEDMLRNQLVAAVGKTLQASEFTAYMRYHNRKLFKDEYQPRPFSHAVRRTAQHSPEGFIRIEEQAGDSMTEPIHTACCSRSASSAAPMQFALNASTDVTFGGERHLHTWLAHSFSGQGLPKLKLVAEARQFSSFIVLVGRIVSAHVFEPKYGMIVQNKDEITIPLDLEQIPTPKQFRDAIESLSPEQQRFAKAFRGMQLESTLFGVLVLQIKPQLETVLKLSTDVLTKEIRLTQDLMEMFIKYQIPSDLLSYDESSLGITSPVNRLNAVKEHVTNMRSMTSLSKSQELEDQELKRSNKRNELMQKALRRTQVEQDTGPQELQSSFESLERRQMQSISQNCIIMEPIENKSRLAFQNTASENMYNYEPTQSQGMKDVTECCVVMERGCRGLPPQINQHQQQKQMQMHGDKIEKVDGPNSVTAAHQNESSNNITDNTATSMHTVDFTRFPSLLDRRYEELDSDSVLRPTIINAGSVWSKKSFKSLMSEAETKLLHKNDQVLEKNAAFDLLDALSKSGALVMHSASLHVVIAATHCFDKSLMDTVVQGNVNPIERVERSALIMASTIHERSASDIISENQRSRVLTYSPQLNEYKSLS
jgi:hypothetical protein